MRSTVVLAVVAALSVLPVWAGGLSDRDGDSKRVESLAQAKPEPPRDLSPRRIGKAPPSLPVMPSQSLEPGYLCPWCKQPINKQLLPDWRCPYCGRAIGRRDLGRWAPFLDFG